MIVFFTPSLMAASSCFGNKKHPALNRDIMGACLSELTDTHTTIKYVFVHIWYALNVLYILWFMWCVGDDRSDLPH